MCILAVWKFRNYIAQQLLNVEDSLNDGQFRDRKNWLKQVKIIYHLCMIIFAANE